MHLCHSIALALLHTFLLFLFASLPESFSFLRSPSKHHWLPLQRLIHWLWLVAFFALFLDWVFYVFKWQNLNIAFCRNFLIKGVQCWTKVYHWKWSLSRIKALIQQSFTVSEKLRVDMIMCWYITHKRKLSQLKGLTVLSHTIINKMLFFLQHCFYPRSREFTLPQAVLVSLHRSMNWVWVHEGWQSLTLSCGHSCYLEKFLCSHFYAKLPEVLCQISQEWGMKLAD